MRVELIPGQMSEKHYGDWTWIVPSWPVNASHHKLSVPMKIKVNTVTQSRNIVVQPPVTGEGGPVESVTGVTHAQPGPEKTLIGGVLDKLQGNQYCYSDSGGVACGSSFDK